MVTKSRLDEQGAPFSGDDLKQIPGIGASVEERLRQAGITSFERLAATAPQELAVILTGLVGYTPERIIKQDWAGQARRLSMAQADRPTDHQRYAVYTLELLLDPDNQVRRTHLLNVQTHQDATWAGWNTERLLDFISASAALNLPVMPAVEAQPAEIAAPTGVQPEIPMAAAPLPPRPVGVLQIQEMVFFNQRGARLNQLIPVNEPFQIHLTVDLSQAHIPRPGPARLTVDVFARPAGSKQRTLIAHHADPIVVEISPMNEAVQPGGALQTVQLRGAIPVPGDYRIEAIAVLQLDDDPIGQLLGYLEGLFVRVY